MVNSQPPLRDQILEQPPLRGRYLGEQLRLESFLGHRDKETREKPEEPGIRLPLKGFPQK